MGRGYDLSTVEGMEAASYGAELARAEEHMDEEYGDDPTDHERCLGWELGECWSCPHEPGCFPDLAGEE